MMSILMEQLINITDATFLGHVGEIELGASAMPWNLLSGRLYAWVRIQYRIASDDCPKKRRTRLPRNRQNIFSRVIVSNGTSPLSLPNGTYRFASHFQKIDQFSRNLPGNYPISGLA